MFCYLLLPSFFKPDSIPSALFYLLLYLLRYKTIDRDLVILLRRICNHFPYRDTSFCITCYYIDILCTSQESRLTRSGSDIVCVNSVQFHVYVSIQGVSHNTLSNVFAAVVMW